MAKKLHWMKVDQRIVHTADGQVRITIEAPYDWHFIRTGQRRLINQPKGTKAGPLEYQQQNQNINKEA